MIERDELTKATRISADELDLLELLLEDEGFDLARPQPILATGNSDDTPLSFAQQRLWFLDQLEPGSAAYNIPAAVRLTGALNVTALERTLNEVVRRHEVLRTVFISAAGQPRQVVREHASQPLEVTDLSHLPQVEREVEARLRASEEAQRPFDLVQGPLLRTSVLRLGEEEHVLLLTMHHIVSDGWSAGVLVREMAALYAAYAEGSESPLEELPIQYGDYARWQREWLQGEVLEEQLGYWREQLAGAPPVLELPTDRPRPAIQTFRGARLPFALNSELSEALRGLGRREGTTLFMTLLAAFQVLLSRYTGQDDIVVGTPIAGRTRAEVEGLIGFFVNTLVVRVRAEAGLSFREVLGRVRESCLGAYAHQDVPFEKLVEELHPERSLTHTPLFQVCFVFQNASIPELNFRGLTLKPSDTESVTAKFDLTLVLSDREGALTGAVEWRTDLFDAETVRRMLGHFEKLLVGIAEEPDRPISQLPLLLEEERRRLLYDWNEIEADYPTPICIHELFERQAARQPEAVAVVYENEQLTYGELNKQADRLARHLRALGVGAESRVALLMERSVAMVAALLGVLKAGGAYVPLDASYPQERLSFMLEDSGAEVLLTHDRLADALPAAAVRVVDVAEVWSAVASQEDVGSTGTTGEVSADNLAYVIYTSGSTGKPKGVMITHAKVARLLAATRRWFGFDQSDVWTLFHSYAFDFSVWEMWGALCHGGRLEVVPYWMSRTPEEFRRLLAAKRVTVLNQTPSAFRQLAAVESSRRLEAGETGNGLTAVVNDDPDGRHGEDELSLRWVIFGGEALDARWTGDWLTRPSAPTLVNMYGITETTVHVTYRPVEESDTAAGAGGVIGRRIPDLQVYVLDARMEPSPTGVAGELHVGGAGLARGYLGRPELTAERFVPHPFSTEPGARLYRTGDLGRYRTDGELEYLGRIDQQVKVRGFRIELGEIEATLGAHPWVRETVVVAWASEVGDKRLVAYVVGEAETTPRVGELREYLLGQLPDYMVPTAFVTLDALPLTPNGKVDRRALPAPEQATGATDRAYVAPRTPVEEILCGIWAEVLGAPRVGVTDNFFELGGDSIRSVRVLAQAKEKGLQLSLQQLFLHQTIGALGEVIDLGEAGDAREAGTAPFSLISEEERALMPAHVEDAYPLAKMQAGMLFHMELMPESALYHNVNSWPLRARFDHDALQAAVGQVVARHAILRTSFEMAAYSEPLQLVHREALLPVETDDLRHLSASEQEEVVAAYVAGEKLRRFDMSQPPLLRFHVHRLTDEAFQFTLTEFHPILDGWSLQSTLTEIFTKYFARLNGQAVPDEPPPHTTYRDFVRLERRTLASVEAGAYWDERLRDCEPAAMPRWPAAFRGATASRMRRQRIRFAPEAFDGLQSLARQAGVPLKSVLLAAHLKVMNLLSGRADVLTGLVCNGRLEESGGEEVRGLFLNTVPFRLDLGRASWLELAQNAFAGEREMLPFRRYPLAVLQEKREPLFETLFNYVHFHVLEGVLGAGRIEAADAAGHASEETNFTVDASFSLSPQAAQLTLTLDCDATQLGDEQIDAIGNYYRNVCERMAVDPSARHDALCLLTPEEQDLFAGWNDTARDYDLGRSVHELFEEQAARTPDAVAVMFEDETLTYAELNERANRLARRLRELGAGAEKRVGLCVERSTRMLVGLLGTLKAGAAYVPLNPSYPAERLAYMIRDAGIELVLTDPPQAELFPAGVPLLIDIESAASHARGREQGNLCVKVEPANAAYVIYTSGSTGQPKGVLISHSSLSNYTQAAVEQFGLKPCDRVLQFASISFDTAAEEIFPCLATGATLVLRDADMIDSSQTFLEKTLAHGITVLDLPTAYWHHLTVDLGTRNLTLPAQLRLVIIGGEEALPERLAEWRRVAGGNVRLVNTYGPTETTIVATACDLSTASEAEGSQPRTDIGSPVANAEAYVLDAHLQLVPVGVVGELCVGGAGVARGYLNQPELTARKFIPHPFGGKSGARLYRTGDLARRLRNGVIEFLVRADQQVKIRGFRIEPGEVEAALTRHPGVGEAAVVARDNVAGEKRLIAYMVAKSGGAVVSPKLLREYLKEHVPDHMVPSAFVTLDALPLTPNGKVDRRALPAPDSQTSTPDSTYVAPRTPTEEVLCGIWGEVLGAARVGIDDDFFELGGHSLLATQVVSRVREALQVEVPLRALFESAQPRQLAARVEALMRGGATLTAPPLVKATGNIDAPLSFAQQRLWFLDQLEPGSAAYNIPAAVRLTGTLNVTALERTLDEVVRRHEVLRTVFISEAGQPRQVVREHISQPLEVIDLSHLPQVEREVEARLRASEEAQRPFDLAWGPLLRTSVLRLGEEDHVLLLTMHHIVSDGWSAGVLVREMATLYEAYAEGSESPLEELPIQYGDYARWQREWLTGEVLEEQLGYWREQLAGAPPVLELPADRPRPATPSFRGEREVFTIPEVTTGALRALGRREGATLFMTLLAAFQVLLSRYTGQDDIVVGTPIAGRTRAEVEGLIGFFVNTLVVRVRAERDLSFKEVLGRVRESCLGAYAHQDVPFEKLVEELHPERSLSHTPLFQVMFSLQLAGGERLRLAGLELEGMRAEADAAKFDLTLWMTEGEHGLNATLEYNTDLFDAATVERMGGHLQVLLAAAVADPERRIAELPLLTPDEHLQFVEWNDTARAYPTDIKSVHELFERQAARQPEAIAVVYENEQLTYGELNKQADRLAHHLRALGVGAESRVGILLARSSRVLVALLGVLKAGGAYVPLDASYPQERLSFMLEDSGAEVLLTQPELAGVLPSGAVRVVNIEEVCSHVRDESEAGIVETEDFARRVSADNLAYVIYTSGSTGKPKGVAISHRSCVAFIHWARAAFDPRDLAVVLASTSICFDLSVFELFVPLSSGTRIVLADNALALPTLTARDEVTLINTVPSAMAALVESRGVPRGVRAVNLAGEALQRELVERVYEQGSIERVMNLYGPTEDTTYSTATMVERGAGAVSIGRPIENTRAYILDRGMQVTPVGVTGEIYLGGAGLARGYLGRPELTAERFVPHPFSAEPGARLYRTGDVARYRPDGELEYLGRIDQQVKVRGFRIELGEIEAALMQHAGVRQAVATADLDGRGEKRLVAYVVAETAEAAAVLAKELREYLLRQLPDYMVPTAFVTLDALPLTPNGKVDRRALPAPDSLMGAPDSTYVAPRTPTEEVLCGIWVEVLGASSGVVRVGIDDDFFELGGHSLLATQVVSRVREALQVEVPLRALFESAQPRQLAARVEALMRGGATLTAPPLVKATGNIDAPLSFAQQRLWFLDQLEPGSAAYNIPAAVRLTGALNVAALERTLDEVVRRHEVLRTVFISAAGQPRQVVREHASQPLEVTDLSHLPQVEREVEARLRASEEAQRPFDLVRGPLLRTSVLRLGEEDHVLLLTMHHIVSDGWSVGVLVREMAALYAAYAEGSESPLEELAIQYGDYARWQREWLTGEVLEEQLGYWREQLAGAPPVLELPADRPRPATPSFRGERESFTIPEVTAEALRALGRREGTTLFMTLLAAFQVLLSRYAGQDDIVVGTPIAGRTRAEVEGLIGFFVNTLVVRVRAERDLSFREVLGRVRESCLGAYAHQDVPFEKLVEELHPERSLSHTPLFQVMFSLQLAGGERLRLAGLELEGMRAEADAAKFDLTLWMTEGEHGLNATLEYNTDLFDAATVERMGGHLQVLLAAAVADSERRIAELPLLTQEEHLRFIEWNDTARDYPADLTVHELFEQQAARQPEAIAVICEDEQLTYRELNEQADRLAHHLRALGAGPESRVALLMERSVAMVAALLGVLKAGGAYVPLDVSYPQERLSFMLEDSGAEVLLTHDRLADALPAGGACVVDVAEVWSAVADYKDASSTATTSEVSAANLAYIIYTSGSTGRPKGVMVEHRQLSNYLWAAIERLRLPAAASYAVVSTLAADLGHTMTFPALCLGGQLHVLTRERASDAEALGEYFRRHAIDCLKIVPSHLEAVCGERGEGLPRLRLVLGGEAARAGLVERLTQLAAPECEIYNHYGPTETTVGAVAQRIGHGGGNGSGGERAVLAGLGQPLGNVRAYVLDGEMRACAVGEAGELYVGGAGVARGYLDRPELTAERFVPDVMGVGGEGGGRLYRTGDVGRVQADGTIEFLGRIDNQIKIRGFRIEVGEIENALASHPSVSEAVVTAREDVPGQKRLIAYVVGARHPRLAATSELRRHLQERLPDYMVPTAFVTLDALPLTPNGKVDRRALPPPDATRAALSAGYVEPQSAAQQVMAEIWADVLGVERVGLEDNFFELGGHSLLATQVISRVREALQCELPLRKLFETPTVAGLVEHVGEQLGGAEVVEEVARTFNELKNLSDEEVRMLLAR